MNEVIVPHDPSRGPLVAVRRMLVHSSIAELGQLGLYDRYSEIIDGRVLEQIKDLIGPGWMPVELALAHYRTCDQLQLSDDVIIQVGERAGDKLGSALLVAGAQPEAPNRERSPWPILPAFARMGRRIYQGASAQYSRTGQNSLVIEHHGNPLFAFHYYRVAHGAFLRQAFRTLNIEISELTFVGSHKERANSIAVQIDFR
jgi:hypothetical protein